MTKKIASCEPIEEDHFEDVKEGTVCDVSRKTISEHCHDNGSGGVRICEPLLLDMLHEDFVDKKSSAPLDQECITQIYTASGQENDNLGTSAWIRLDDNNVLKHKPLIQNQEDYNVTYVTREHDDPGMPDETELSIHNTQEEHEFDLQSKSTRQQKVNYQPEVYKERNYEKGKIKERFDKVNIKKSKKRRRTRKRNRGLMILLMLLFCGHRIHAKKCKLTDGVIQMDMDLSTLTFNVCYDNKVCTGKIFRWDKDLDHIFFSKTHEKSGPKYDFYQDQNSGCIQMIIKNVTKNDSIAVYTLAYSSRMIRFVPEKQPITVGKSVTTCDNGTVHLISMLRPGDPGDPKILQHLQIIIEKDGLLKETQNLTYNPVQNGSISIPIPINENYTSCNFSVVYQYMGHRYILLQKFLVTKDLDKCKDSTEAMRPPETNNNEVVYIVVGVFIIFIVGIIFTAYLCKRKGWFKRIRERLCTCIDRGKDKKTDEEKAAAAVPLKEKDNINE